MLKTLKAYIGEYKKTAISAPIFIVFEVIFEMIIPMLMAVIIDNGLETGNINYVVKMGLVMLLVSFASLFCGAFAARQAAIASTGFAKNVREGMYNHIQEFSFSNIDHFSTAGLVTRLTTDVTNVQNAFQMMMRMLMRAPVMLITAMTMTFIINAKLSCVYLVALVFLGIVIVFLMGRVGKYFRDMFDRYDDLNADIQENLTGIRVVKAYVREEHEKKKFGKASEAVYRCAVRAQKLMVAMMPTMQFTVYACIIAVSWLGARTIVAGDMTTGQLMSLFTYTMNILMSLMFIAMVAVMLTMARSSAERICEVLNESSDLTNKERAVTEVPNGAITFDDVTFSYRNDEGNLNLNHINLDIKSGETVGILGGTGSAKSTLVQLIPRLYDVTGGSVRVGGIDVRDYDLDTLRNQVSMVLQKNVLFSGTIKENLRWGDKNASDEELVRVSKLACADEFIQRFPDKYDTWIEQGGSNVSGGQKQRLCIARALLKKPKILILDDSTSAVDTHTDAMIRKAFREEIPDTTKLIIAQRISSVQDSDKIIVLDDGEINGIGTHEELLKTNAIYREVYESQQKPTDNEGGDAE
ncbi:ABC transporter ATP-binding protein [Anaerosacchariphilus sp. NSJ-68]|uniref:ABC transporter ATP-binding protein n=2 Tax=Lachnospiraceae TaxID=186803 RepID=A0A923RNF7_9FIRM|nr:MULTISPECIES: ABC transporter ATP-binding protein [Lachnospiraceae]MBC5660446.1 ABC transporter ATP-binding protein [Anaerosacchariphilus hominis]MBC5697706.1 ABC transporter ATP-binding protein [Roseburia difficilis]